MVAVTFHRSVRVVYEIIDKKKEKTGARAPVVAVVLVVLPLSLSRDGGG